jgi:hypothetical protein
LKIQAITDDIAFYSVDLYLQFQTICLLVFIQLATEHKREEERVQLLSRVYDPLERKRLEKILELERADNRKRLLMLNHVLDTNITTSMMKLLDKPH